MIAKIHTGSGFKGTIDYILDTGGFNHKRVLVLATEGVNIPLNSHFLPTFDTQRIAQSFRAQSMLRPGISKPVRHLILSCHENDHEKMTPSEWVDVAKDYMERMGIRNTQFLIVTHKEKNNPHIHIIYNVVDNDGGVLNEHNFLHRNRKVCLSITLERGYTIGKEKAISKADINNPLERVRYALARTVTEQLYYSSSMDDLQKRLARCDVVMQVQTREPEGKTGVVFITKGEHGDSLCFSGRSLGRYLSYGAIQKVLREKETFNESLEKAGVLLEEAAMLQDRMLSANAVASLQRLESIYLESIARKEYCYREFPARQAEALSTSINAGSFASKMSRLINLLTPPVSKARSAGYSQPHRQKDSEMLRSQKDEGQMGRTDVDFEDRRYEEKLK